MGADRVRLIAAAYRDWARDLVEQAAIPEDLWMWRTPESLLNNFQHSAKPDLVMLVGWSWMVPPEIYDAVPTICLHPSPLPRYRGGSPLQHQIIAGETESAVTIFRVTKEVDQGPIYAQAPFSLDGSLAEIFERIVRVGAPMLRAVADPFLRGAEPPHQRAQEIDINPPLKRRKPEESNLTDRMLGMTPEQLRNFIRALDHPDYPRAYLQSLNGEKVELGWVRPEPEE